MYQPRKKYLVGLDRFLLHDKQNPNNYLYVHIRNGLNSNKNKKGINQSNPLKKSSSHISVNNSYMNKSNISNNNKYKYNNNISPNNANHKSNSVKTNNNIRSYNMNNRNNYKRYLFNSSLNEKNNKKINSLSRDSKTSNGKYNIKTDNKNNSFVNNQRSKTPILNRENNKIVYNFKNKNPINGGYNGYNVYNRNKNNDSNLSMLENRSMRNYNNNIFQPVNIFSQFKRNKANNNDDLKKNTQLLKKFLEDDQKNKKLNNSNNNITNNKPNKIINIKNNISTSENNISQNKTNITNNSTPISSGNIIVNKNNSNNINVNNNNSLVFDKNNSVHEINFYVNGIPSTKNNNSLNGNINKKKIFKGKKIKCMHDLSKTGLSGDDKKVNQDNYFIFKNFVQGFENIFMGVCDGHGYYGHEVSGYIKENLPMDLNHMIKTKKLNILTDDISSIIKTAFILENKSLLRNKQIDSDLSGSTCVSVIYTPQKLIIANIGDSRCVLGKCLEKDQNIEKEEKIIGEEEKDRKGKKWVAKNLSRDHKPTIPEEAERILKKGGRIRPMKDDDGEYIGPLRVYMKEKDMPGLAMTRSFGDYFGSTAGVISEPEVTEYFFKEEDKFMVLASDGLFEFMESQEVIEIIKDYYEKNDIVGCCEYLYKESTRKWLKEEEDTIDDITIILVFFDDYFEEVDS